MSLELQTRLSQYFDAINAHRPDDVAALFSPHGLVHAQGQDHCGNDAIRDWADDTFRRFALRVIPSDVRQEAGVTLVRAQVAGAFIGSPIHQLYRFKTSKDAIEELIIA